MSSATTPPIETRDRLDESDSETVRRHAATFRRVRLARVAAVEAESERPSDQPAPQVPGREASSDEVPRGAAGIAKHARAHGWTVREVYSRGPGRVGEKPSDDASDGAPSSEEVSDGFGVELVTVRCRRPGEKPSDEHLDARSSSEASSDERWACAVYRRPGSKWVLDACLVADASDGLRRVRSAELRAYLAIP